jgi:hypothetical protein
MNMSIRPPIKPSAWVCARRFTLTALMLAAASFVPGFGSPLTAAADQVQGIGVPSTSAPLSNNALLLQACSKATDFLDIAGQGSLCQTSQGWMMRLNNGQRIQVAPPDNTVAVLKNVKPYATPTAAPAAGTPAAASPAAVLPSQCVAAPQQRVELVYAHFQGAADNFSTQAPDIQAQFAAVDTNYTNYDGQHFFGIGLHLKIDCDSGNQPIVHDVALSTAIDQSNFNTIVSDLQTAGYCRAGAGPANCAVSGPVHYWVYTDGNPAAALGYAGQSSIVGDDSPSANNQINQSDQYSINYGYCLNPAPGTSTCNAPINQQSPGYGPQIFAHENGHAMGAVQLSAPDTTGGWHCTDGVDVMCYNDGGPTAGAYSGTVCGSTPNGTAPFDCHFNDYFNPAPAPGSYLATHWNLGSTNNRWALIQPAATTTSLQTSASNVASGQPVTFTATTAASSTPHPGMPAGSVIFSDGSTTLGTVALDATGRAAYTTSSLGPGSHAVTAAYGGSGMYATSSSSSVVVNIGQGSSQTAVASSQNPSAGGQSITLTVTTTSAPPGGGTPTGAITLYDGATQIGSGTLANGSASFIVMGLSLGSHALSATYAGDSSFNTSSSSILQQLVLQPSSTVLSSSALNQTAPAGASLTFTAAVTATNAGQPAPTGSVTFNDGATPLATVGLINGSAGYTTSGLPPGVHTITAAYGGDPTFAPSNASLDETVGQPTRATAVSTSQYRLAGSDGVMWQPMDPANLTVTLTAQSNTAAILTANSDLWTADAGINQDFGILLTDVTAGTPATLVAWKESGGFAGTFSPNAAFVQAVVPVTNGHVYVAKLVWKANQPAAGKTIFAGAGPVASGFSPTRLTAAFLPSASDVTTAVSHLQYPLANSDGATWVEIDPALRVAQSPLSADTVRVSANADLWTMSAGCNQDLGVFVSIDGAPDQLLAWKESGGFAGTFSPNAAYAQTLFTMLPSHRYVFKLEWKANQAAPGSNIMVGAGGAPFSPTSLTVEHVPGAVQSVSAHQNSLVNSDGVTWKEVDGQVEVSQSPSASQTLEVGGNLDLWTAAAGFNQDVGIAVSVNGGPDQLLAWKESGGFAGTFSPNAAFVDTYFTMQPGSSYVFKLVWKTNRSGASTIVAGAGPIAGGFSPTSLLVVPVAY